MDDFWTEQLPITDDVTMRLHVSQEEYNSMFSLERGFLSDTTGTRLYVLGHPMQQGNRLGNAQAWFYPADGVLMLWECFLGDNAQPPAKDERHRAAWRAFERELVRRFRPSVILTPAWEPIYPDPDWQEFLRGEGYSIEGRLAVKRLDGQGGR